jgi:hypothetical protein
MLYKTIALELLQEQYPKLHEQLRLRRQLLAAVENYAVELRDSHRKWLALGMDASAARELAVEELREILARDSSHLES